MIAARSSGGQLEGGQDPRGLPHELGEEFPVDHHLPDQVLDALARHALTSTFPATHVLTRRPI